MNKKRREQLDKAIRHLEDAERIVQDTNNDEMEAMEAVPENLQSSSVYENMEKASDLMSDAIDALSEAREALDEARNV